MFRLRFVSIYLFVLLCLFGNVLPASAQSMSDGFYTRGVDASLYVDGDESSRGPYYIPLDKRTRAFILPRISTSVSFENNATLDSNLENESTKSALTISIVPGLMLMYGRREHNHVYVDLGVIVPVYTDNDRIQNEVSRLATVGGRYGTGLTRVDLQLGYRRLESVDTLVDARVVRTDLTSNISVERRISSKTSLSLLGSGSSHDYESDQYVDYQRVYGAGRYYQRVLPKSDMFLQAGYGQDYLDRDVKDSGDAEFFDVSIGMRGKQTPKSHVQGSLGYRWRQPLGQGGEAVSHYIASINGETSPFGFTALFGGISVGIFPSSSDAGATRVGQRASVGLARRLFSERIRGQVSLFYAISDYYVQKEQESTSEQDSQVFDGRQDHTWGYGIGVDWWLPHNFSIGVSYSYSDKTSDVEQSIEEEQAEDPYSAGRWTFRASWNY